MVTSISSGDIESYMKKYGNIRLEKEKDTKGNKKSSMDKKTQNLSTIRNHFNLHVHVFCRNIQTNKTN